MCAGMEKMEREHGKTHLYKYKYGGNIAVENISLFTCYFISSQKGLSVFGRG